MTNTSVIVAKFTPDKYDQAGQEPETEKTESVTIVEFCDVGDTLRAVFIDSKGKLRSGYLRQFTACQLLPVVG